MAKIYETGDSDSRRIKQPSTSTNDKRWALLNFIDEHIREIKWALYGIGCLGGVLIFKEIYAFKQFKNISEVPTQFINKNVTLQGRVTALHNNEKQTEDKLCVIWAKHEQLLRSPLHKWLKETNSSDGSNSLPIGVAGIKSSPPVLEWLERNLQNQHIWFKMLQCGEGKIDSVVSYRKGWRKICVNEEIIRKGIGQVYHYEKLPESEVYQKLIFYLLKLESQAVNQGAGMWKDDKPSYWTRILSSFKSNFTWLFWRRKK